MTNPPTSYTTSWDTTGVYLLATLKRDEMVADGRRDEIDRTLEGARKSQSELTSGN